MEITVRKATFTQALMRKNLGGVGVCELGKRSLQNNATRIAAAGIKGNT